jgi:hypothetical protein
MKLKEAGRRLVQLVTALGVFFSGFAANYALHNLAPGHDYIWMYFPALMGIALPLAWAYTFAKVPEEARLATARLATVPGSR